MRLTELRNPAKKPLLAVIYPGRFQPFHKGHYGVYKELIEEFGAERVWIATSNKTNFNPAHGDISPLNFEEKQELMTRLYGITPQRIVQCKNPAFSPSEILDLYHGPTVCLLIVGKKDQERYSNTELFEPWPTGFNKVPKKFADVADELDIVNKKNGKIYYLVNDSAALPGQSGTTIRDALLHADEKKIPSMFKRFFGKHDPDIERMLMAKLRDIKQEDEDDKPGV